MDSEKIQEISFELILASGDARTMIHQAFEQMRISSCREAQELLDTASDSLVKAHRIQSKMLQEYASGTSFTCDILLIHAQDHLMTTMTLREVALEMLGIYQKMSSLEEAIQCRSADGE
ncbi:PTS lactose/cellobiose transporter subunit IIA [Enterococcus casseliflavus]|uniref:PTS lactose/cellobiose transporter subunit IIA n=1 Tax=Enterococcus casseliflavus TaxID=37734 RepID=UPI003D0967D8